MSEHHKGSRLDAEAQVALGNQKPAAVWLLIQILVAQAFECEPEEAQRLMQKYQPGIDEMGLDLTLQNLDPVVGISKFQYLNQKVDLQRVMKAKPMDVLEGVLRMITISDKWLTGLE